MIRDQRFLAFFAILWTLAGMVYVGFITFYPIPDTGKDFAKITIGFLLGTAFTGILGWAFDSTFSQTKKDSIHMGETPASPAALPNPPKEPT